MSKFAIAIIFILFLAIQSTFILAIDTEDPIVNITLDKIQHNPKEKIDGNIILNFSAHVEDISLEVFLGDQKVEKKLTDVLTNLSKTHHKLRKEIKEKVGPDIQIISFPPNKQEVGLLIPKTIIGEIESTGVIAGLEASDENFPKAPYIDINPADNIVEWAFLGNILGYETTLRSSGDLNENDATEAKNNKANQSFCEKIEIPRRANKAEINIRYRVPATSNADVKAAIIAPASGGSSFKAYMPHSDEVCDLGENTNMQWDKCIVSFKNPQIKEGHYLFCIFSEEEGDFWVATDNDNRPTDRSFACTVSQSGGDLDCSSNRGFNYFIKISLPEYDGILDKSIQVDQGFTSRGFELPIKSFASKCTADESGNCVVPIEIGSQTSGKLVVGGLNFNIGSAPKRGLSNFITKPAILDKIQSKKLEDNYKLSIPISEVFPELTTPDTGNFLGLTLRAVYGSESSQILVEVIPTITETLYEMIGNTHDIIEEYTEDSDKREIASFLGNSLSSLDSSLENYESDTDDLYDNDTITDEEKEEQEDDLRKELQNLRKDLPQFITINEKIDSFPGVPPTNINDKVLPSGKTSLSVKDYVLSIQSDVEVSSSAKSFKYKTFSSSVTQEKTIITRRIFSNFPNAYVVEIIPKNLLSSASGLILDSSTSIIEQDPIIKKDLTIGQTTITYMVDGDVVDSISDIKTLIVSTEGASESIGLQPAVCGDNKCALFVENKISCPEDCTKKTPWTSIIIIIVLLIIGIYYINFYKGKGSFGNVFKGKKSKLFKTESDRINIINYVKKSLKHNPPDKVTRILISKGWNQKQIQYALKQVMQQKR